MRANDAGGSTNDSVGLEEREASVHRARASSSPRWWSRLTAWIDDLEQGMASGYSEVQDARINALETEVAALREQLRASSACSQRH